MMRRGGWRESGAAAVEAAMVLPLLVLLALPAVDIARALQAHLILVSISREGASMAARGAQPLGEASQSIMDALAATAPPLDMQRDGMLFITRVMGRAGTPIVLEQHRWRAGGLAAQATVSACTAWNADSSCAAPGGLAQMPRRGVPDNGEVVHAFEVRYRFHPWFPLLPGLETDMHVLTIF